MPHLNKCNANEPWAYKPQLLHWYRAASLKRWIFFISTALVGLVASAALLHRGLQTLGHFTTTSLTSLWKLGFGRVDPLSLIAWPSPDGASGQQQPRTLSMIMLANLPQVLISVLHLNYNSLFTCMLMEK